MGLKKIVKSLLPFKLKELAKQKLNRWKRLIAKRQHKELNRKLSESEFRYVLTSVLRIGKGDTILVHSSYGMLNTAFSPQEAVEILKEVVGENGNILMPYYPKGLAIDWLRQEQVFSVFSTKSSMGILTQAFADSEGVKKSLHPVKSVVAWGKNRDDLISEHHLSRTPYDEKSPYYKAGSLEDSKSIGLGILRNTYFHCCEDLLEKDLTYLYEEKIYTGKCEDYNGEERLMETKVHKSGLADETVFPCAFLEQTKCPSYRSLFHQGRKFYVVENGEVFRHLKERFNEGINRKTLKKG